MINKAIKHIGGRIYKKSTRRKKKYKVLLLYFVFFSVCYTNCVAKSIINPIFDRTDTPSFHIDRIDINSDTIIVTCSYDAEKGTRAYVSKEMYIQDIITGRKYTVLKAEGLPFSPKEKYIAESTRIQVILFFPPIITDKINLIENENERAFNIYGIDLNKSYDTSFALEDMYIYFNLAQKKEKEEHWATALDYSLKQLEASNYVEGIRSFASVCSMYNIIMNSLRIKEYENVIVWGQKAIDILSDLPQDSVYQDLLARTYGNISTAYHMLKQHETATKYMELSLAIRRMNKGVGTLNYVEYLGAIARNYYYEENYPKALLYEKEVASIYERKYEENNQKYGCIFLHTLGNLCEFSIKMDSYEEAIEYGKKALKLLEDSTCEDVLWLKLAVYNNIAASLASTGKEEDAISYLETILSDSEYAKHNHLYFNTKMLLADILLKCKQDTIRVIDEYEQIKKLIEDGVAVGHHNYPDYKNVLYELYRLYNDRDSNIAIQYLKKAIQVQKEWQGETSVAYANLLLEYVDNSYVKCITEEKNIDSLFHYLHQSSDIIKRHINNSVFNMSKTDRDNYWLRYEKVFTWLIPTISGILKTGEWNSMAYDASLFYKGMLLASDIELKNIVSSSNDSTLIYQFTNYVHNLSLLEALLSRKDTSKEIDSLTIAIKENEYYLSQKISRFNKQRKGTNYTWKEVSEKLKDKDVAIEFISYESIDGSTIYYDAYVINNMSTAPLIIPLFNDSGKLKQQLHSNSVDYNRLSSFIWGNEELKNALNGAKNIYFSPSGLLNSIGIEYLPIGNGQYIFDKYNIFRLSSTRELCYKNSGIKSDNVCIYGGLDYNSTKHNNILKDIHPERLIRSMKDTLIMRAGFEPLIGSKQEIEQLKEEIDNKVINLIVYTDSEGTEESFKNLSGKHINIIHLSTHGMYIPDDDNQMVHNNNFRFVISDEMPNIDVETRSLTRSFLVMSGGNMLIRRDSIPHEKDDGILTAQEISYLDFIDLDLVVLSACQTALGQIASDGIYGLQRGFKKAGANTILMSLDKVDDEATKILMVEFYKNLMEGKTKHQSLKDAQKYLRQINNGKYDKPEYWASFILLDGLY